MKEIVQHIRNALELPALSGEVRRVLNFLGLGILLILALKLLIHFALLLWVLRNPGLAANDATVYLSLGHGIVNGLRIYRDIFEIKPPGIFLISSLSIFLSKGFLFALVLQMFCYIAVPVLLVWHSKPNLFDRLLGAIFGLSIAIFLADRTNGLQPEGYGAFFSFLYLLSIRKNSLFLSASLLLAAIWMKEPFLLSICGAVLLLAEDIHFVVKRFLAPLLIAGIAALILLAVTGVLQDYFSLYLSEIFSGRLLYTREFSSSNMPSFSVEQPIWVRGLMFRKVYEELPWLGFIIPLFVFGSLYLKRGEKKWVPVGILAVILALYLFRRTEIFWSLFTFLKFTFPIQDPFFRKLLFEYVAAVIFFVAAFIFIFVKSKTLFFHVVFMLLAIYLTTLAVCMAGTFNWHHFAFAAPAYFALYLLFRDSIEPYRYVFAFLIVLMAFIQPKMLIAKRFEAQAYSQEITARNVRYSSEIDRILNECDIDRYMVWIKELNPGAFTEHSPSEFYYAQLVGFTGYSQGADLKWRDRYLTSLRNASIFFSDDFSAVPEEIKRILQEKFTDKNPCVSDTQDISVFFRKEA